MAKELDDGFKSYWNRLRQRLFQEFRIEDELREFALNAFTDGFYAGREYEAELAEESDDE